MNNNILSERLGYRFRNEALLEQALSHSSYVNEKGLTKYDSNERLEFLGDAMLEGFVSSELYNRLPFMEEGDLTKLRARVVCEKSLFRCATVFALGDFLNLGRGEEGSGGRKRPSVVADAMEAVIGAIFLDGGREAAEEFVMRAFAPVIDEAVAGLAEDDYKSKLQETVQAGGHVSINYKVEKEEGPDHDKVFHVSAYSQGVRIGFGTGKSKKQAEQSAARNALESMM
ncbi:MAG: ribonuclease III [Clostridiales Family XIII bacterium]|jgi:ribonuclease-3|nr:ribonuclease III [Clostridiales Family XIII bacterium]